MSDPVTNAIKKWHEDLNRMRPTIYSRIKATERLFSFDLLDFKYEHKFYEANLEDLITAYNALTAIYLRTEKYLKDHK